MSRLGGESRTASIGWTLATAVGLLGVGLVLQSRGGFLWNAARGDVARARAEDRRTAGYYEDLLDAGRDLGAASWTSGESDPVPEDWLKLHDTDGVLWDEPFQRFRLRPGADLDYKGAALGVNDLGLRDRPTTMEKPDGVHRVAVVGSSILMGSGVPVASTFENLVEDAIVLGALGDRGDVELLNFGVAGYRFDQLVYVVRNRVLEFDPDAVVVVINDLALNPNWSRHLAWLIEEHRDLRYDGLQTIVDRAGIDDADSPAAISVKLEPFRDDLLDWGLGEIADWQRSSGVPVVLMAVSQPAVTDRVQARLDEVQAVFDRSTLPMISLLDAYDDHPAPESLWLRPYDRHPTAEGHRLLAEAWLRQWQRHPDLADVVLGPDRGSTVENIRETGDLPDDR
jgi:hypothetical protein